MLGLGFIVAFIPRTLTLTLNPSGEGESTRLECRYVYSLALPQGCQAWNAGGKPKPHFIFNWNVQRNLFGCCENGLDSISVNPVDLRMVWALFHS